MAQDEAQAKDGFDEDDRGGTNWHRQQKNDTFVDTDDYINGGVLESEKSTFRLPEVRPEDPPEDQPEDHPLVPSDINSHDEVDINIPKDSFSMFYVANTWKEHLYPVIIFLVQMLILALIFNELTKETDRNFRNLFNLKYDIGVKYPIGVTPQVIIAQYIACLISVFTATDFVDGIMFSRKRIICKKEGGVNLNRTGANFDEVEFTPSATNKKSSMKWEASNLMRMVEGLLVVCVSFIFIVQSSTVLDLFLNFAAVTFVSELDDIAFELSDIGFMGNMAHRTAKRVLKHKVDLGEERNNHKAVKRRNIVRFGSFSSIVILMWIGLSIVVHRQYRLKDACKSVTLTVGETKGAYLRHLSGSYTYAGHQYGRAFYVQDQGRTEKGEVAFIGYSEIMQRWTVTLWEEYTDLKGNNITLDGELDFSCCYDLQSERTLTYDIKEVSEFQHYSGDPIDSAIKCNECKIGQQHEELCGWAGTCKDSEHLGMFEIEKKTYCECFSGFYGESCQFLGPCTELEFQDDEFPGYGKIFSLLYNDEENPLMYGDDKKPLMFHGQPTYYILKNPFLIDQVATLLSTVQYAVLLFDGGRWIVITSESFCSWDDDTTVKTISDIPKCLANFNPSRDRFEYSYISEYSNGGTPENIAFRASFSVPESGMSVGKLGDAEFSLVCADCSGYYDREDDDDDDYHYDNCQSSGKGSEEESLCKKKASPRHGPSVYRCNCENGFVGPLCQTRPAEGKVMLYLEHDKSNSCSVCGENNMWNVWDLLGLYNYTCLPFPREPLLFEGGDGTTVSRQLGLHMNDTHFSVFVSNKGRFFPHENDDASELDDARELICSVQEGTSEIYSIERSNVPSDQTNIDLAVLLDNNTTSFGKIVDPGDIDCFTKSKLNENQCDGSSNLSLREVYDPSLNKTGLMRVWIQLDLEVTV